MRMLPYSMLFWENLSMSSQLLRVDDATWQRRQRKHHRIAQLQLLLGALGVDVAVTLLVYTVKTDQQNVVTVETTRLTIIQIFGDSATQNVAFFASCTLHQSVYLQPPEAQQGIYHSSVNISLITALKAPLTQKFICLHGIYNTGLGHQYQ